MSKLGVEVLDEKHMGRRRAENLRSLVTQAKLVTIADVLFCRQFEPVIKAANHDGANRSHSDNVLAFPFTPFKPALYRLADRNALKQAEAYRRIDADPMVGCLSDCWNSGAGDRTLDNHV